LFEGGGEVISDFRVMGDQRELFGRVASVPTAWRTLAEIAGGGERALSRMTAAVNAARRRGWAQIGARHGALPGVRMADRVLEGVTCVRLDASVVACHSEKEGAEPNFKGFGLLTELPGLSSQFSGQVRSGPVTVPGPDRARGARPDYGQLGHPAAGGLHGTGDLWEPYQLLDPAGEVVPPVAAYLRDLQAAGRATATQRSYGMD